MSITKVTGRRLPLAWLLLYFIASRIGELSQILCECIIKEAKTK